MAEGGHFEPTAKGQLLQHVVHVALDRVNRDPQPIPDLLVAQPLGEKANHFTLPVGQAHRLQNLCGRHPLRIARNLGEE